MLKKEKFIKKITSIFPLMLFTLKTVQHIKNLIFINNKSKIYFLFSKEN
jgi:hypothetical protein